MPYKFKENSQANKKKYYLINRDRILKKDKLYRLNNKDTINKKYKEFRLNNPVQKLLYAAKSRAKTRGIEYNLTVKDVTVLPISCPVLGIKLNYHKFGRGAKEDNISLDRIDNSKGYVAGNVQIISMLANMMKNCATPKHLRKFADWINKTYA